MNLLKTLWVVVLLCPAVLNIAAAGNREGNSGDGCRIDEKLHLYDFLEHGVSSPYMGEEPQKDERYQQILKTLEFRLQGDLNLLPIKEIAQKLWSLSRRIPELGFSLLKKVEKLQFKFLSRSQLKKINDLGNTVIDDESCDEIVKIGVFQKNRTNARYSIFFDKEYLAELDLAHQVGSFFHEVLGASERDLIDVGLRSSSRYTREQVRELNSNLFTKVALEDFRGNESLLHESLDHFGSFRLSPNVPSPGKRYDFIREDDKGEYVVTKSIFESIFDRAEGKLFWLTHDQVDLFSRSSEGCTQIVRKHNDLVQEINKIQKKFGSYDISGDWKDLRFKNVTYYRHGNIHDARSSNQGFFVLALDLEDRRRLKQEYERLREEYVNLLESDRVYPWLPFTCLHSESSQFLKWLNPKEKSEWKVSYPSLTLEYPVMTFGTIGRP